MSDKSNGDRIRCPHCNEEFKMPAYLRAKDHAIDDLQSLIKKQNQRIEELETERNEREATFAEEAQLYAEQLGPARGWN